MEETGSSGPKTYFVKVIDFVENKLLVLSIIITFVMTIFITIDAITRYLFDAPIPGAFELTEEYFMPVLVALALSAIYTRGGHVRVTMFLRYIPKSLKRPIAVIMDLLALVFAFIVTYGGMLTTINAIKSNEYSISILAYPLAPAYGLVALGFGILTIRLIISLFYPIDFKE